jgi:hypothetical protein
VESESSLQCPQKPATARRPILNQLDLVRSFILLFYRHIRSILILFSHLRLRPFSSRFPDQNSVCISPRATCHPPLLLPLTIRDAHQLTYYVLSLSLPLLYPVRIFVSFLSNSSPSQPPQSLLISTLPPCTPPWPAQVWCTYKQCSSALT